MKSVGRALSADGSRLVQKFFYFRGDNREQAERAAARLKAEWRWLVASWDTVYAPALRTLGDAFADIPHWTERKLGRTAEKTAAIALAAASAARSEALDRPPLPDEEALDLSPDPTLTEIQSLYLARKRQQIGIADGIELRTYRQLEKDLAGALRGIEGATPLSALTGDRLDAMKQGMLARLSKRTAVNYLKEFKRMLDWAYNSEISGNNAKPKGYDDAFTFKKFQARDVRTYTPEVLKELLAASPEWVQLNILLGLNCGMYGIDIGELQLAEVHLDKGYLYWRRSKTEAKNEFRTRHDLWESTRVLLKKHLLKMGALLDASGASLALATPEGKPWARDTAKGDAVDYVGIYFRRVTDKLDRDGLRFKDFRKTAASRLAELAQSKGIRVSQQYRGEAIPGVSNLYLAIGPTAFDEMNGYLQQYGEELAALVVPAAFDGTYRGAGAFGMA